MTLESLVAPDQIHDIDELLETAADTLRYEDILGNWLDSTFRYDRYLTQALKLMEEQGMNNPNLESYITFNLAEYFLDKGWYRQALHHAQRSVELCDNSRSMNLLGQIYERMGEFNKSAWQYLNAYRLEIIPVMDVIRNFGKVAYVFTTRYNAPTTSQT